MYELVACTNAGDVPRLTALWSDDFFRRGLAGISSLAIDSFATQFPSEVGNRTTAVSVEDVRILPDGRVSAIVHVNEFGQLDVFVESDGRYLLDESVPAP